MKYYKDFNSYLNEEIATPTQPLVNTSEKPVADEHKDPIKIGSNGEEVKALQNALVKLGFPLSRYGVDGKFGYETLGQLKSLLYLVDQTPGLEKIFGNVNKELDNNQVSIEQQQAIVDLANNPQSVNIIKNHYKELEKKIAGTDVIAKNLIIKHIEDPEAFIAKLIEISKKLQINPNWLMLVMYKESKVDPKAVNKKTQASGLIQFMPSTAKGLGTSVESIQSMSGVDQLDLVYKYFAPYIGRIKSVEDLYLITFFPVALGKSDDTVLQTKTLSAELIASQNPAVDVNKDGEINVGEFKDYVQKDTSKITQNINKAA